MSKAPRKAVWILAGAMGLSGLALAQDAAPQADAAPGTAGAHGVTGMAMEGDG